MNAGHRADDILPDLTNHFGSSRSAKAARRKHGSSLARKPTSNAEAGPSGTAGTGLLTPPSSQSQAEMDARRMLISPPPEEFLRRNRTVSVRSRLTSAPAELPHVATSAPKSAKPAAKRKRQISAGTIQETSVFDAGAVSEEGVSSLVDTHVAPEATPNGKPRKQSKRHVSFVARETSPPRPSTSNLAASVTTPTRLSRSRSESPTKRVLFLSPHQTNPRADYIPPSPSRRREFVSAPARRRSVTPVFPYEPPPERFTPPREVFCSPPQESPTRSRTQRRKSVQSAKGAKRLTLTIKKEPPVIDLTQPLPPPSPTDDPLLLSGPPRRQKSKQARPSTPPTRRVPSYSFDDSFDADARASVHSLSGSTHSHSRDTPPLASSSPVRLHDDDDEDAPLPELIMSEPAHMGPSDATFTDDDDAGDPMPAFDFAALDAAGDDDWSDDDRGPGQEDAEDEATGEYTGRFRMMAVPTKADPPSSCTRIRMDAWGRPKSPHPHRSLAALEEGEEDRDEEDEAMEEVEAATVGELEGDSAELEDDDRHPPVEIEPQSTAPTDDEKSYEVQNQPADSDISGEVQEVVDLSVHDDLWAHSSSPVEPHDRTNTLHHEFYVPIPNDAQDIVDTSVPEPSRTPSSSPIELLARPAEPLDDFDVLMDDASDQDTLTEPDLDLADDFMSHLSSQEKQGRMGVPSVVSPLPSTSTIMTETPVVEVQVEAARSPSYVSEDEDEDKDEEDRSDEAIIDRELSVLPDEDSDVDDEVEDTTTITEHASRLSTAPRPTNADASDVAEQQTQPAEADEYDHPADDDDGDESDTLDDGVIKITSDDPLAAARAAAILRLHDYDCVPRILTKKRRHSHLDAPSVIRDARRRSSLASGINKGKSSFIPNAPRRHTLGGMLGDKVFIPGSPAMTVPELLNEAERSLDLELTKQGQSMIIRRVEESRNAFVTPMKPGESSRAVDSFSWATPSFSLEDMSTPVGRPEGAWTRKDWKRLDSCLTDERLVRGEGKALADVELLDLEKVVDRFLTQLEGSSALQEPSGFNREDVLRRARALQKKQQSGRVAPPTPSSFSLLAHTQEVSSLEKECITPQGPASSTASATSSTIADGPQQPRTNSALPRPTFATRIKGLFTSYLPVASSSKTQPVKKPASAQPGLPVPPPETFAKPRAPIHTPAPKPVPKPVPPKNTVHLNNVPPPKPSRIPRGKEQPRRLVELHPLPAPPSDKPIRIDPPAKRRSSGGSVKDLIMAFEGLGEDQSSSSRPASVASVRGGSKLKERPLWRP